jgi:hypothetical protein
MSRILLLLLLILTVPGLSFAAAPVIAATATTSDGTSTTNHVHNLPTGISAGDLLIACHAGGAVDSTPNTAATGWTLILELSFSATVHAACLKKVATGSEGATVTITTDLAETTNGVALRITGHNSGTTAVSAGVGANTTTPDPDALTPPWGSADTLWIAVVGVDAATRHVSGYPANMPDNNLSPTNAGDSDIGLATVASTASSFDPNAFAITGGTINTATFTIAVAPGGTGTGGMAPAQRQFLRTGQ